MQESSAFNQHSAVRADIWYDNAVRRDSSLRRPGRCRCGFLPTGVRLELRFFDEALGFAELETGGSTLAIAAHSLGKMLMPDGYMRPVNGQPAGVEIAFLTRDVSVSFAKAIAEGASPITSPRRMPRGLEVAYVRAPEGTIIGFSEPPPSAAQWQSGWAKPVTMLPARSSRVDLPA